MKTTFRRFMAGFLAGVAALIAFVPVIGQWAPVLGLAVALAIWC